MGVEIYLPLESPVLALRVFLYVFAYGATIMLTPYFREARGWEAREAIELVGLSFLIGAFGYVLAAYFGEFLISRRNTIVAWCWLGGLAFRACPTGLMPSADCQSRCFNMPFKVTREVVKG